MIPSNDSFIRFQGDWVVLGDPQPRHSLRLLSDGPGPTPGLRTATVLGESGAWEISYEECTGRIADIADAPMPDLAPAESEAGLASA